MIYIALLRGINVGGKNKIKMAELRDVLTGIGLSHVRTYIQSGNILFESEQEENTLKMQMEQAIKNQFGFAVSVILRTKDEWEKMIQNCPFTDEDIKKAQSTAVGESLYVTMLEQVPDLAKVQQLEASNFGEDQYKIVGRDVYLLFHHSIRNSKLAYQVEKLSSPSTTRNWKTIDKLYALASRAE